MPRPKICYKKRQIIFFGLSTLFLILFQNSLHAQSKDFHPQIALQNSKNIQKTGMIVLGSWATLNLISGSVGFFNSSGDTKYFHQMNAAWNIVNLGIAGFGYHGASSLDPNLEYAEALKEMRSFEKVLLINAGLDLAYIGAGAWLWKRGLDKKSDRQVGYGKSLILQGGFLLIFDTVLYLIHHKHTQNLLQISDKLTFSGNSLVFSF